MGNSPVDKGKDFIESGMTLVTEMNSERYLKKKNDKRKNPSKTC